MHKYVSYTVEYRLYGGVLLIMLFIMNKPNPENRITITDDRN